MEYQGVSIFPNFFVVASLCSLCINFQECERLNGYPSYSASHLHYMLCD